MRLAVLGGVGTCVVLMIMKAYALIHLHSCLQTTAASALEGSSPLSLLPNNHRSGIHPGHSGLKGLRGLRDSALVLRCCLFRFPLSPLAAEYRSDPEPGQPAGGSLAPV